MKRKLKGVLGVALAFMLVASLMAFAVPVAAADYTENDWGEWGLAAIEPDTDVGPIAVAPDGTLYAAVGPTRYDLKLDSLGDATAEFSDDEAHSGSSSVKITMPATASSWDTMGKVYVGYGQALSTIATEADLQFTYYSDVGAPDPFPALYLDTNDDGVVDFALGGKRTDIQTSGQWVTTEPYVDANPWRGGEFNLVTGQFTGGTSWNTLAHWQSTHGDATVVYVALEYGGPDHDAAVLYVDDVTINGLTYDLEGTTGTTGEALLGFGSELQMSEDNGYTWDDTDLDDAVAPIVDIAISPNYEEDETVYVGCADGTVYCVEEAGDESQAIMRIPDVAQLFSLDVWTDEDDYNWILVGTDIDVFVLKDKTFERWRDQALNLPTFEVAFAPDFDDDQLMWAVTVDDSGDFLVTSTVSPGDWGQEVGEVVLPVTATPWLDIGFPDDYDSDPDTGDTNLWLAVSGGADSGDIFLVEGVNAGDGASNENAMFTDIGDEDAVDFLSIAVSGDYGDEVILAGELNSPTIWISDDGGNSWGTVDKSPTGENFTHVIMEADAVWDGEVFDPDDGMAFASTFGNESAVSKSTDGGQVYNQVGLIDTEIDEIIDLGFHPDFPSDAIFLMITEDDDYDTYSLWFTENGAEDEPDYERVLCAGAPGNFAADSLKLVEFSQNADAIYIFGDDGDDDCIWKSIDDGQTFPTNKKRDVDGAQINDWVITEDDTIYAAANEDGFYKTTNSGLSWSSTDVKGTMNDIALSPDFEEDEFICLGGQDGTVKLSDDAGDAFDDTAAGLTDDVFVAFDADFADEDADGYMLIYAAGQGDDILEGEVDDTDDVDWDALEDDENEATQGIVATGLQVSEDNALYAIGELTEALTVVVTVDGFFEINATIGGPDTITIAGAIEVDVISGTFKDGEDVVDVVSADLNADSSTVVSGTIYIEGDDSGALGSFDITIVGLTGYYEDEDVEVIGYTKGDLDIEVASQAVDAGLTRLLLHESNSEWESQADASLDEPMGLWLTPGTNVLWTIDWGDAELWALEDTCSGQVTLDSPPDGYQSEAEEDMRVAWDEVRDAEEYDVKYTHVATGTSEVEDGIDDTDVLLTELRDTSEYDWKVRVSPGEPWHSRWSGTWSFHTALGAPPWSPTLYTPGGVWQYSGIDVDLMPAFSWESATSADSYQFMLADNAEFASPLVNEKVPESAYQLDFELEYNSNYFWKVMAYKGTAAISRWSDIGAFTTIEKAVAPPAPAPPATVTQPAPGPIVIPTPIPPALLWTIIGIGALLIIAVIVLIIRTRRVV